MATYLAVGDAGRILCDGADCSGAQDSGTDEVLYGAARSSFTFSNGVPLRLVVGEDGTILRMRSGGRWRKFSSGTTRDLNDVSIAPGTDVAWAVGDEGTILKSSDAGETWGVQSIFGISRHLNAVHAVNEQVAWAAGDHGLVLRTTDGGGDWQTARWGEHGEVALRTAKHLRSIVGLDADRFAAVGDDGVYLKGKQHHPWDLQTPSTVDFSGLAISGHLQAISGDDGLVMISDLGFVGWQAHDTGTSENLNGIIIVGNRITAVGNNGTIVVSPDRGATWTTTTRGSKHLWGIA
jgi:photosystem II stability/assembly factor-like uncharacterized protein